MLFYHRQVLPWQNLCRLGVKQIEMCCCCVNVDIQFVEILLDVMPEVDYNSSYQLALNEQIIKEDIYVFKNVYGRLFD